jgi:hypothetical protein
LIGSVLWLGKDIVNEKLSRLDELRLRKASLIPVVFFYITWLLLSCSNGQEMALSRMARHWNTEPDNHHGERGYGYESCC